MMNMKTILVLLFNIVILLIGISCSMTHMRYSTGIYAPLEKMSKKELKTCLCEEGFSKDDYNIYNKILFTNNIAVLRTINRINAYFYMHGTAVPFFVLKMKILSEKREYKCITQGPASIKKDFNWRDYEIEIKDGKAEELELCKEVIDDKKYSTFTREALREKYFNESGQLKEGERRLRRDPDLIYALIEKGYYVYTGCIAGDLSIVVDQH